MSLAKVIKRNGDIVAFNRKRIVRAVTKAYQAAGYAWNAEHKQHLLQNIDIELQERFLHTTPNVEDIQDIVEQALMKIGAYDVAKTYILYRQKRSELRAQGFHKEKKYRVRKRNGKEEPYRPDKLLASIHPFIKELVISTELLVQEVQKSIFNYITSEEIEQTLLLATASFIERDPAYNTLAARLFRRKVYREVLGTSYLHKGKLWEEYRKKFIENIHAGVKKNLYAKKLLDFDLPDLADCLQIENDELLNYMGIYTLYDRYFLKDGQKILELPQTFWMRVAMGLALAEKSNEYTKWAKEFYQVLTSLYFIPSTPTLFHSGLPTPQLSSCYLTTIRDDLHHIFKCIGDNAQLSKWSGGIGNDWTSVRALGAPINSTHVTSQGVIPFLKIANDTTVAINRSGKRRGATCAYLEVWHLDIYDFVDLRRNTGDERRRTHDMNIAVWIPDLFMKRVEENSSWTLFSPDEVPDLHDLYGEKFEKKYELYEQKFQNAFIHNAKEISAVKLWRRILTRLFETGHPWITFKDPCNIRSSQDHAGVIHSSNLCTEITLNSSVDETAVCNLGSLNLARHTTEEGLNQFLLAKTISIAMRMLDNVIDLNFYPTKEAKNSNLRHRPIGLGLMGFQDALYIMRLSFESEEAILFADAAMEFISYHAIQASTNLAKERGSYSSYKGSKWDRGIFPIDTIDLLEKERGLPIEVNRDSNMDWQELRNIVHQYGMRNSNVLAIAPTATISNIAGCFPCIEPIYKNIYVKSNMSGEFTEVNKYLIRDLKQEEKWDQHILDQLKYYDGKISLIPGISEKTKTLYKDVFDIDPIQLLKFTAVRGKWIDQSQSHNIFLQGVSGQKLDIIYRAAWRMGLKTTYYLRSLGASQIEKSTLDSDKFTSTQKRK